MKFFLTILLSVGLLCLVMPTSVKAAGVDLSVGDLIKTATNPAVYYYGSDRKKHSFSNEATFWTWHIGNWSNHPVKTVSQDDFEVIPFGNHVTARPGENFVRFENSNEIYAVKPGGELCFVDPIYANKQKIKKILIQQAFQADYKESLDCSLNDYTTAENMPEGSIFRYENTTQNFYMSSDGIRPITTADGWNNNLMNINSVLIIKDPKMAISLPTKTAITTEEEMFKLDYEIKNRNNQSTNPVIYNRTRPCNVANGMGQQSSSDRYNWSTCVATTCNNGYTLSNGSCVANADYSYTIRGCGVQNGRGQQSSSDGGASWGICRATVCDYGYFVSNGACVINLDIQPITKSGSISRISTNNNWLSDGRLANIEIFWLSDVVGKGYYRFLYSDNTPQSDWYEANSTQKITEGYLSKAFLNYLSYNTSYQLEFKVVNSEKNTETNYSRYRFFTPEINTRIKNGAPSGIGYSIPTGGQIGQLMDIAIDVRGYLNGMLEYRELYSDGSPMENWVGTGVVSKSGDGYKGTINKSLLYGTTYTFEFRFSSADQETYSLINDVVVK